MENKVFFRQLCQQDGRIEYHLIVNQNDVDFFELSANGELISPMEDEWLEFFGYRATFDQNVLFKQHMSLLKLHRIESEEK